MPSDLGHQDQVTMERNWLMPLIVSLLISVVLVVAATLTNGSVPNSIRSSMLPQPLLDEQSTWKREEVLPSVDTPPLPPRLAYLISGSKGQGQRMIRLLQAIYHPRNQYVLHLDLEAPSNERDELHRYVKLDSTFVEVRNVHVVRKANMVTYRGPSMVATTLHGAAILLKQSLDWDWFINLSASDYPLITQDDLLHVLSYVPRDLNFIHHSSDIGWMENQRARPIIIDPGLYLSKKSDIVWLTEKRALPTSFRLFTGSAWVALSRSFMEFCIWGWDNLPRAVLMYYANYVSSPEGYFHTVICNSPEFRNTTVNNDLHYISWDNPPRQHPQLLNAKHIHKMTDSGAAFARKFAVHEPLLDTIDKEFLGRSPGRFTPGGWCKGNSTGDEDPCKVIGDDSILNPGLGSQRFEQLILRLISPPAFRSKQCIAV